jgi:predicted HTH domain antitoxin
MTDFQTTSHTPLYACFQQESVHAVGMLTTVEISVPASLLLHSKDLASLELRSRLLLALKFFELGELTSGQAAEMCGLSRVAFLFEAGKQGIPVSELSDDELAAEFA